MPSVQMFIPLRFLWKLDLVLFIKCFLSYAIAFIFIQIVTEETKSVEKNWKTELSPLFDITATCLFAAVPLPRPHFLSALCGGWTVHAQVIPAGYHLWLSQVNIRVTEDPVPVPVISENVNTD